GPEDGRGIVQDRDDPSTNAIGRRVGPQWATGRTEARGPPEQPGGKEQPAVTVEDAHTPSPCLCRPHGSGPGACSRGTTPCSRPFKMWLYGARVNEKGKHVVEAYVMARASAGGTPASTGRQGEGRVP